MHPKPQVVMVYEVIFLRLLTPLINLSFQSGVFPDRLKIARIKPIFKGVVKFDRENYRPICVLPVVSKIHR